MSQVVALFMFCTYFSFLMHMKESYQCVPYNPTDQCEVGRYEIAMQNYDTHKYERRTSKQIVALVKAHCVFKQLLVTHDQDKPVPILDRKGKYQYRYVAQYVEVDFDDDSTFFIEDTHDKDHGIRRHERLEFPMQQTKICRVE